MPSANSLTVVLSIALLLLSLLSSWKGCNVSCTDIGIDIDLISTDPNRVRFFLHTNASDQEEIIYRNETSLDESSFNPNASIVFITHGFYVNSTSEGPERVLQAYQNWNSSVNYILVDWRPLAGGFPLFFPAEYLIAVINNVPAVGKRIADFILFLKNSQDIDYNSIHLVGHSLGAHVSGCAGKVLRQYFNGTKVPKIIGLDPAGPTYYPSLTRDKKLSSGDARFVEVIHTNAGALGDIESDGHVDFWPNGGTTQRGCNPFSDVVEVCSHSKAWELYEDSFTTTYTGCRCGKDPFFLPVCLSQCPGAVRMGFHTPVDTRGNYYVRT